MLLRSRIKKNVLNSWILSYVSLVLVSLIFSVYMSCEELAAVNRQRQDLTEYASYSIAANVQDTLDEIYTFYNDLIMDLTLTGLYAAPNRDAIYETSDYWYLADRIRYLTGLNTVDFFYLYLEQADAVISKAGVLSSRKFHHDYMRDIPYEDWRAMMQSAQGSYGSGGFMGETGPVKAVTYTLPIRRRSETEGAVVLAVLADTQRFLQGVNLPDVAERCTISVYASDQTLLAAKYGAELELPGEMDGLDRLRKDCLISVKPIDFLAREMYVVVLMPKTALYSQVGSRVVKVIVIFLLEAGILAALLYFVIKRNYRPFRDVVHMLEKRDEEDEYAALRRSISENIRNEVANRQQQEKLKRQFIARSLRSQNMYGQLQQSFQKHGIVFPYAYFSVALFDADIDAACQHSGADFDQEYNDVSFILSNVMEELLHGVDMEGMVVEADDLFVCIINAAREDLGEALSRVKYGVEFIQNNFDISLRYAVVNFRKGINSLPVAYRKAMDLMEHMEMFGRERAVTEAQFSGSDPAPYYYSADKEMELTACIRRGDAQGALALLDEVFAQTAQDSQVSLPYFKCMAVDMMATLLKLTDLADLGPEELAAFYDPEQLLRRSDSIQDVRRHLAALTEKLCQAMPQTEPDAHLYIYNKVVEYVQTHYNDPNLNLTTISEHFHLSPPYLSKIFRMYHMESLSDYINKYRLEQAKTLMREGVWKMNDVFAQAGFGHIRTFNRVFKKYEGMSPTEYMKHMDK